MRPDREFRTHIHHAAGKPTVVVSGEIDVATAPEFERSVLDAAGDSQSVILDLRDTSFMDSTGLSVLVRVAQHMSTEDMPADIVIDSPLPAVHKTLKVSGLDRLVTITGAEPLDDCP